MLRGILAEGILGGQGLSCPPPPPSPLMNYPISQGAKLNYVVVYVAGVWGCPW